MANKHEAYFNIYSKGMKLLQTGIAAGSSKKSIEKEIKKDYAKQYRKPFYVQVIMLNPLTKAKKSLVKSKSGKRKAPYHYYRPSTTYDTDTKMFRHRPRGRGGSRPVMYTEYSHMLDKSPNYGYRSRKRRKNPHPAGFFEDTFGRPVGWMELPDDMHSQPKKRKRRRK